MGERGRVKETVLTGEVRERPGTGASRSWGSGRRPSAERTLAANPGTLLDVIEQRPAPCEALGRVMVLGLLLPDRWDGLVGMGAARVTWVTWMPPHCFRSTRNLMGPGTSVGM